ncbi:MAG TPA: HEAT repeat domain-containing protein [Gemmataceae bacterium]|nr:HEAT repeat domain-containing protein [Gemmataceae bacterium]
MSALPLLATETTRSSYVVLAAITVLVVVAVALYYTGVIGAIVAAISWVVRTAIWQGFRLWERTLSWASWPVFLGIAVGLIILGAFLASTAPGLAFVIGLVPVYMGVTACLAYMFIDVERYEVERGYKAVHNPDKGQALAEYLVKYDEQVTFFLLTAAAVGSVGGFALINFAMAVWRPDWFYLPDEPPAYSDFVAFSLVSLYNVVNFLDTDILRKRLELGYVRAVGGPASALLGLYKSFFTLVLLQQVFASIRKGRVLAETIADFWSPHEPIRQRARSALPQYGPVVVEPLLVSLRSATALTKEQRDLLPGLLSAIGPSSIPTLIDYLGDPHEHVRAVCAGALGQLKAAEALGRLAGLTTDPSDFVRASVATAAGQIADPTTAGPARRRKWFVPGTAPNRRGLFGRHPRYAPPPDPPAVAVEALRTLIGDTASTVRLQAAEALGRLGPAAFPACSHLVARLRDEDETVRCAAAITLGGLKCPEAVEPLRMLLQDPSPEVKAAAAKGLAALNAYAAPAVPELVPLLQDQDQAVRDAAAEAIGKTGPLTAEVTETLAGGLASEDTMVRARTAEVIGTIGPAAEESAPALVELLDDENDRVRAKAVKALSQIGEGAADVAVPRLVRALRDPDAWVSALAAEALGEMGESAEAAVPALVRSLRHGTTQVRANAADALGKLGGGASSAVPALVQAAADEDGGVRAAAFKAVGEIGTLTPAAVAALRAALIDGDPRVRSAAVEALGRVGSVGVVPVAELLPLLQDSNDQVKARAAQAIPRIAEPDPVLIGELANRLLEDDSVWVQAMAARTLGTFGAHAAAAGPALVRIAQTAEAGVRDEAMRALVLIQPAEAVPAFIGGLADADPDVRKIASAGWRKAAAVPEDAVPALIDALKDPEEQVRANAAFALGRLADLPPAAIPALKDCAASPNDGVRLNAALALRNTPAATDVFDVLLDDANPRIRLVAVSALLAADDTNERAGRALVEVLTNDATGVHRAALGLVGSLGAKGPAFVERLRASEAGATLPEPVWEELRGIVEELTPAETTDEAGRAP